VSEEYDTEPNFDDIPPFEEEPPVMSVESEPFSIDDLAE